MSLQVENLEKNMAKMTVEVPAETFEKAIKDAYNNNKKRFNIPGFRRGKAPLPMIEKMYGVEVFYEEAANIVLDQSYPDAAKESGLEIVSRPEIDLVQIEKGKPFIYTATVAVKPEVTLGDYKGIQVEKASAEVTDQDVENELKRVQNQNSRLLTIEDRPVQDKDQVVIDFDGYMDGQPFEGGKSEDYSLTIGSHSFIDTFEEQLIGKNIGEECEVNVTFPEEYHVKDLAGKPALFKVVVKEIKMKELPELNDEFAEEVSEFETLDEYREDIRSKLLERKQKDAATENENRVVEKVVENASMEIPEKMLETQVQNMINDYARRMQSQGMSMDQYMQYTGMTMESLQEQTKPQAERSIRTRLVLEAVVKAEDIQITDEKVEEELQKMADTYKMDIEKVKGFMGERELKQMREDLAVQEAVDFLVAEAELV
mgnify:CR=1 FL=1